MLENVFLMLLGLFLGWIGDAYRRVIIGTVFNIQDQLFCIWLRLRRVGETEWMPVDFEVACPQSSDLQQKLNSARSLYLAGTFNDWLNAEHGAIIKRRMYAFRRTGDSWKLRVLLLPGEHTFKLVIDEVSWISFSEESLACMRITTPCSNYLLQVAKMGVEAPGGSNFAITLIRKTRPNSERDGREREICLDADAICGRIGSIYHCTMCAVSKLNEFLRRLS